MAWLLSEIWYTIECAKIAGLRINCAQNLHGTDAGTFGWVVCGVCGLVWSGLVWLVVGLAGEYLPD